MASVSGKDQESDDDIEAINNILKVKLDANELKLQQQQQQAELLLTGAFKERKQKLVKRGKKILRDGKAAVKKIKSPATAYLGPIGSSSATDSHTSHTSSGATTAKKSPGSTDPSPIDLDIGSVDDIIREAEKAEQAGIQAEIEERKSNLPSYKGLRGEPLNDASVAEIVYNTPDYVIGKPTTKGKTSTKNRVKKDSPDTAQSNNAVAVILTGDDEGQKRPTKRILSSLIEKKNSILQNNKAYRFLRKNSSPLQNHATPQPDAGKIAFYSTSSGADDNEVLKNSRTTTAAEAGRRGFSSVSKKDDRSVNGNTTTSKSRSPQRIGANQGGVRSQSNAAKNSTEFNSVDGLVLTDVGSQRDSIRRHIPPTPVDTQTPDASMQRGANVLQGGSTSSPHFSDDKTPASDCGLIVDAFHSPEAVRADAFYSPQVSYQPNANGHVPFFPDEGNLPNITSQFGGTPSLSNNNCYNASQANNPSQAGFRRSDRNDGLQKSIKQVIDAEGLHHTRSNSGNRPFIVSNGYVPQETDKTAYFHYGGPSHSGTQEERHSGTQQQQYPSAQQGGSSSSSSQYKANKHAYKGYYSSLQTPTVVGRPLQYSGMSGQSVSMPGQDMNGNWHAGGFQPPGRINVDSRHGPHSPDDPDDPETNGVMRRNSSSESFDSKFGSSIFPPQFHESGHNVKTVFSYHGIKVERQEQASASLTAERSAIVVWVGAFAICCAIAILLLWCDLAYEESKPLHNYTHWCSNGLVDYIPFYAFYVCLTLTGICCCVFKQPLVKDGIRAFLLAVKNLECLQYRYSRLPQTQQMRSLSPRFSPRDSAVDSGFTGTTTADSSAKKKKKKSGSLNSKSKKKTESITRFIDRQMVGNPKSPDSLPTRDHSEAFPDVETDLKNLASQMDQQMIPMQEFGRAPSGGARYAGHESKNAQYTGGNAQYHGSNDQDMQRPYQRSNGQYAGNPQHTVHPVQNLSPNVSMQQLPPQDIPPQRLSKETRRPRLSDSNVALSHIGGSPCFSEGTAAAWQSCDEDDEHVRAARQSGVKEVDNLEDVESSSSSEEEEETPSPEAIIAYHEFNVLRAEVQRQILAELTPEQVHKIKQTISGLHTLERRHQRKINQDMVTDFCEFFGCAEAACMRFLKVTGWVPDKALERIARMIMWKQYELPVLQKQARDVLDKFNENPLDSVFPCVGSYFKEKKQYQTYDGCPIELWRCCKIDLGKLFGRFSEKEIELAYVNYILRKEATCRRCNAVGVFVLVDCEKVSLSSLAWHTGKLKVMAGFMGKYGEQFFPDSIAGALVYNAPKGVDFVWKIVSGALSAATREKIQILKGAATEEVSRKLDPRIIEELQKFLPNTP